MRAPAAVPPRRAPLDPLAAQLGRPADHPSSLATGLMPLIHASRFSWRCATSLIRRGALKQTTLLTLAAIGIVAGACQPPGQRRSDTSEVPDTAAIRASIDSLTANVKRANETGDAELYATTWARDGMMSNTGSMPVHGRDSIVAKFRQRPPLPPGATMTIHPTEFRIQSPEWAYVMGVDTLRFTPPDASAPVQETYTFLVILRKTAEGWQTYREVLSANQ